MNFKTPATLALVSLTSTWGLAQTSLPPNAPVQDMGRVEIKSNRDNVMEERRQSTAAKIVIGREELDKQGDGTVGEVLKRLPGVTIQGAPGRGGAIRMTTNAVWSKRCSISAASSRPLFLSTAN